jgi:cytoskeletal protein CcmA (bactofilin family)
MQFTTALFGVDANNQPTTSYYNFTWESDWNGTTGHASLVSKNGVPVAPLTSQNCCNGTFDGTFNGNITVASGQSLTFTNNGEITGSVTVNGSLDLEGVIGGNLTVNGGSVFLGPAAQVKGTVQISQASTVTLTGAAVSGNLKIQSLSGGSQATVCGTQVKGNLQAQTNASPLEIGGTTSQGCAGNTIGGNLTVSNNTAALQVDSNTVGGNLTVDNDSAMTDVSGNSVGGNLECQDDNTVTHIALNMVKGNNQGQCAAFP